MEEDSYYEFRDNLIVNIIRTNDVNKPFYSYTEYILEFKVLNNQKILKKRFSDFVAFYEKLKEELYTKFNENIEKIAVIPTKKVFGRLNYNFVEERRQKLESFLRNITRYKKVYLCETLYVFLSIDNIAKYHYKLMCTEIYDMTSIETLLKQINYILFMSRNNTLRSAECDIINFLFYLKNNVKLNNDVKFFILNIFLHHLTYTKNAENLLNVPLMKFAFEIIYDNLKGKQINEILLKTASEIILRIADKKNEVFLEYLKIYNFKEICSIFNVINKKKEKEKNKQQKKKQKKTNTLKIDTISCNIYILISLLLLSSIHIPEIQDFFSVKYNNTNKGIKILGYMYESLNINIQIICCIILSLLIINKKITDEDTINKTKMSILLIQNEIQNIKNVDYQLIEIICSKKNITILNSILEYLLQNKEIEYNLMLDNNEYLEKYTINDDPFEKDLFYEKKIENADFSNNDIILQFILYIISIGINEFFLLKKNNKYLMKNKILKMKIRRKEIEKEKKLLRDQKKKKKNMKKKNGKNSSKVKTKKNKSLSIDSNLSDVNTHSKNNENNIDKREDIYKSYDIESVDKNSHYENITEVSENESNLSVRKKNMKKKNNNKEQYTSSESINTDHNDSAYDSATKNVTDKKDKDGALTKNKNNEFDLNDIFDEDEMKFSESSCISDLYSFSSEYNNANNSNGDQDEENKEEDEDEEEKDGEDKEGEENNYEQAPFEFSNLDEFKKIIYDDEFSIESGSIKDEIDNFENDENDDDETDDESSTAGSTREKEEEEEEKMNNNKKDNMYKIKEEIKILKESRRKFARKIRRINEQIILILCNEHMINNIYKCAYIDNYKIKIHACMILCYIQNIRELITNKHTQNKYVQNKINAKGNDKRILAITNIGEKFSDDEDAIQQDMSGVNDHTDQYRDNDTYNYGNVENGEDEEINMTGNSMQDPEYKQNYESGINGQMEMTNPDPMMIKKNNKYFICSVEQDYYNYIYKFHIINTLLYYLFNDTCFYEHIFYGIKRFIESQTSIMNLNHFKIRNMDFSNLYLGSIHRGNKKGRKKKKKQSKKMKSSNKRNKQSYTSSSSSNDETESEKNATTNKGKGNKIRNIDGVESISSLNSSYSDKEREKYKSSDKKKKNKHKKDYTDEDTIESSYEEKNNNEISYEGNMNLSQTQIVPYTDSKIYNHINNVFDYVDNLKKLGYLNNIIVNLYMVISHKLKKINFEFLYKIIRTKFEEKGKTINSINRLKEEYEHVNIVYNDYIQLQYEYNKCMSIGDKLYEEFEEIEKRRKKLMKNHKHMQSNVSSYRKELIKIEKIIEETPSVKNCLNEQLNKIKTNVSMYKKDKKKLSLFIILHKIYLDNYNYVYSKLKNMDTLIENLELLGNEFEKNMNLILNEFTYLISNDLILVNLLKDKLNITINCDDISLLLKREKFMNSINYKICDENHLHIVNKDTGLLENQEIYCLRNLSHNSSTNNNSFIDDYKNNSMHSKYNRHGGSITHNTWGQSNWEYSERATISRNPNLMNSSHDSEGIHISNKWNTKNNSHTNKYMKNMNDDAVDHTEAFSSYGDGRNYDEYQNQDNHLDHVNIRSSNNKWGAQSELVDNLEKDDNLLIEENFDEDDHVSEFYEQSRKKSLASQYGDYYESERGKDDMTGGMGEGTEDNENFYGNINFDDDAVSSDDDDNNEIKNKIDEFNNFKNIGIYGISPEDIKINNEKISKRLYYEILEILKRRRAHIEKMTSPENNHIYKNIHKFNNLLNKCGQKIEMCKKLYSKIIQKLSTMGTSSMVKKSESIYKFIREWDDKIEALNEELKLVEGEKQNKEREIAIQQKKIEKKENEKQQKKEELGMIVTEMYKHNNKLKKMYKRDEKIILLILYNSWFFYHYIYIIYLNTIKLKNYLSYKISIGEMCQASAKHTIMNINCFSEMMHENDY
ncbi:phosphoinositide-binding protein, putative [Plasmodium chabaudi chabaudi]|uniref:Phosphoinositide-binding protein, putative n=1 Tax=Plasmodium chabaudi chabaudi TaxID=31271 RepID=A0A4V6M932_PLACU|nr:phosphoinositide-binding protein, putative [Plasmodium chabaudi chabaudi]VTZ67795.1 phosphoinositide-binding protein, putative [Plasmodium chabaudi chabaudi]|eukprot:XP_016653473.1 phosphoinositide-binding protein, putative [Plasmodium chabaudi chabaudi]